MKVVLKILLVFFNLLKYPLYILLFFILYLFIFVFIYIIIQRFFYKRKLPVHTYGSVKNHNFLRKIFIDVPVQIAEDKINSPADFFHPQGILIFEGRQGSGKTISLAEYALRLKDKYPCSKCLSNLDFSEQDFSLVHWKQLINFKNSHLGVIVLLDELQNWFGSNQSRNFPPEMLSVITQNRKNRRIILGTSQSFHLLAKSIRSQVTEVRKCYTIFGCVTFVKKCYPILNHDGDVEEWKNRGFYWFVHNKRIRDSYDTWAVVDALTKSGFKENVNDII